MARVHYFCQETVMIDIFSTHRDGEYLTKIHATRLERAYA
jgi:hypothetical protein